MHYAITDISGLHPKVTPKGRPRSQYDPLFNTLLEAGKGKAVVMPYDVKTWTTIYVQMNRFNQRIPPEYMLALIRLASNEMAIVRQSDADKMTGKVNERHRAVLQSTKDLVARVTTRYGKLEYDSMD